MAKKGSNRRWVRKVSTESTSPPRGTFNKPAAEIARTMARKNVSPKGPGSGVRMIQYFINRGGKNLSASRRAELERAKRILQRRAEAHKTAARKAASRKTTGRKTATRAGTRRTARKKKR